MQLLDKVSQYMYNVPGINDICLVFNIEREMKILYYIVILKSLIWFSFGCLVLLIIENLKFVHI